MSSGITVSVDVENDLLNIPEYGQQMVAKFKDERLLSYVVKFHEPIRRSKLKLFRDLGKKMIINNNNCSKVVETNRNMLGTLLACTAKYEKPLDFEEVLCYPLALVPLSIANPDGTRLTTKKSNINKIIMEDYDDSSKPPPSFKNTASFIVDMMAAIRCLAEIPETYDTLAWNFLKLLPKDYPRVDIVADSYFETSLKQNERNKRGVSEKVFIASNQSKIPRDFKDFLLNGQNKLRMIELIIEIFQTNRVKALNILRCNILVLANENNCVKITMSTVSTLDDYVSNQEDADTKIILHAHKILEYIPEDENIIIRSHSADGDINVIAITILQHKLNQVFIDFGKGAYRKGVWLGELKLSPTKKKCLLGYHAFSGNDYISSFFRKSKLMCWKVMKTKHEFQTIFANLGNSRTVSEELTKGLEEYVCNLYGSKEVDVNKIRYKMFQRKFTRANKIIDLSLLPPCKDTLTRHKTSKYNCIHLEKYGRVA